MLIGRTIAVDTTPTLVVDGYEISGDVIVRLQVGSISCVFGGSDVSTANGFNVEAGTADFELKLQQGDSLYAVSGSSAAAVGILVYNA